MTEAPAAECNRAGRRGATPWSQQLVEQLSVPPAWAGLGVSGALFVFLAYLALLTDIGVRAALADPYWRMALGSNLLMAVMVGYAVAATAYSQRAQGRALWKLRSVLDLDEAGFRRVLAVTTRYDARSLRWAGASRPASSRAGF